MFADFIKSLLQENPEPLTDTDARIPLTALLVRIARSDNDYAASEMIRIEEIAQTRFGLSKTEAARLRADAEQFESEAPDTVRFTRAIKEAVPYEARVEVIEALWQVALADGERDAAEDSLIRLVASLLGFTDQENARARQRSSGA